MRNQTKRNGERVITEVGDRGEIANKVARYGKGGNRLENALSSTTTNDEVRRIIQANMHWFGKSIPQTRDQLLKRVTEFFEYMEESGEYPTWEKFAVACGVDVNTLKNWESGRSHNGEYCEIVSKVRSIMAAIDSDLARQGKIPANVWKFTALNFYGMKDQQEVVVRADAIQTDTESIRRLERKYAASVVDVEVIETSYMQTDDEN